MNAEREISDRLARIEEREKARDKAIEEMSAKINVMYEAFVGARWVKTFTVGFALVAGFFIGIYRDALSFWK